ncbi:MAG TPA: methyltransferase [Bryobacteraceae bacterium]|nr:methyltransferase [Bryobacteraceae bacterium]
MDLPPVCALADEAIAAAGLNDRFRSQPADLFEGPYPGGADTISLSWVLHNWNNEHCRQILRHCHAALPAGGMVLITESVLEPDGTGTRFATLMSLHMLVLCEPGARERTEAEYAELLDASGFRRERLIRLNAPRDLLIATRL